MTPLQLDKLTSSATCANFLARTILFSLRETVGDEFYSFLLREIGDADILARFPPDDLKREFPLQQLGNLFSALESVAGEKAKRGLLHRSGRACFLCLQRRPTPSLGIFTAAVLTLPKARKVKRCAEILGEYFQRYTGFIFSVEPTLHELLWRFEIPFPEIEFSLGTNMADLWSGFWYELLYTLSGGKPHLIEIVAGTGEKQLSWALRIPYLPFEG
ncbi:MAG: hypothetical protein N3D16_00120 [Anaerolineales bacterium]|nr:hypothetical protein [Anaerolineales bacterium]